MATEVHNKASVEGPGTPDIRDEERAFVARALRHGSEALERLAVGVEDGAGDAFTQAIDLIVNCADAGGTVLVSGLGKSGHVGAKISATMASLGITSHAVHPTEAAHGDLGRFRSQDLAICLSHSGETEEVVGLAQILKQDGLPVIAITRGSKDSPSALERVATVTLAVGVTDEAGDGDFLAPTTSTTATIAVGDALALATARRRAFTRADFQRRHPGGQLGGLLRPVTDLLRFRAGQNLPLIDAGLTVSEALAKASETARRPGAMLLVESDGTLAGIFTDSDLRRLVLRDAGELGIPIASVMTRSPRTLPAAAIARDAVAMFREHRQDEIPVVDEQNRPVGLLDVQDLIAMRLVRDDG